MNVWRVARNRCGSRPLSRQFQRRHLSIHEYQSQSLLRDADIMVPVGHVARNTKEVSAFAKELGGLCVLKAQILAGGRGKGHFVGGIQGGIQVVNSVAEATSVSARMLGHKLVTKQTKKEGLLVESIYISEKVAYKDEYYLSMTIDRENCCPAIIASRHGGMDIEAVSNNDPESVVKLRFDYKVGITDSVVESVATALGIAPAEVPDMRALLEKLFVLFKSKDATLLEINPLVRTLESKFLCLDAKFTFDNAAAPRQKDLFALAEKSERDASEVEAEQSGLVYVRLDGNIGNVVNGAGLAMATNDAISYYGGKSANFLDAGGQATKETMVDAFRIILKDDRVKVILVNIYGGIIRCDMIAESIIAAADELGPLRVPIVVRLQGTNAEQGQQMIADCGLNLYAETGFGEAARRATEMAAEGKSVVHLKIRGTGVLRIEGVDVSIPSVEGKGYVKRLVKLSTE